MRRNEHRRVKHRHLPGDISKRFKIAMREKRTPIEVFPWQILTDEAAKTYRKDLTVKGRTVQRRRDKQEIDAQLDSAN